MGRIRLAVLVACMAVAPVVLGQSGASAAPAQGSDTAGTGIGNAAPVQASATGSLTSRVGHDWWVIYPSTADGPVAFSVTNTSPSDSACQDLYYEVDGPNGTDGVIDGTASVGVGATSAVRVSGSAWYYIDLSTNGCGPPAGQSTSYSIDVASGGDGTPPNLTVRSEKQGTSIGTVGTPLRGHSLYKGSLGTDVANAWYVLDSMGTSSSPSTVRIANTTVQSSSDCSGEYFEIDNADGTDGVVQGWASLAEDGASTYTFATPGQYYIDLDLNGCSPGTTAKPSFSVEPEPASGWAG